MPSLVLVVASALQFVLTPSAQAAQIVNRTLTLQTGTGGAGGSTPGGIVNHAFSFTLPGGSSVGSIQFLYCTTAAFACTTPTGLSTSTSVIGNQTGVTGFTLNTSTNGAPYLTRSSTAVGAGVAVSYRLDGVINPSAANQTFFVRISTFASNDTTGSAIDAGTVAASTADPIVVSGVMPESLVFCTGETITTTLGVPDCTTATAGTIDFPMLFSPTATAYTSSQMAASTNAGAGYSITYTGPTLTSGANTIQGMDSIGAESPVLGTSQFGLNLKLNTVPVVGAEASPAADAISRFGQAIGDYATADKYKFTSGDAVANSNSTATDSQIYTVSYVVNVPGNQPAGTYTTTLTYICTPTF